MPLSELFGDFVTALLLILWFAVARFVLEIIRGSLTRYRDGHDAKWGRVVLGILAAAAALLGLIVAIIEVRSAEATHYPLARVIFGTVVVVAVSGILFLGKVYSPKRYAVVEGAFALFVCIVTLQGMTDAFSIGQLSGLGAAVYLCIRAMDNYKKGYDEAKKAI